MKLTRLSAIIGLFALLGIMSSEANAQYVRCGSVFTAPHGRVAGTVGFAARECDPPRQQRATRLPYPGGTVIAPRRLHAHAVPLDRPIMLGGQRGANTTRRVVQREEVIVRRTAALGTPGGGYVAGAPRSPQECGLRGGTNTGRGCSNYQ